VLPYENDKKMCRARRLFFVLVVISSAIIEGDISDHRVATTRSMSTALPIPLLALKK
jgi:hypothetical protein